MYGIYDNKKNSFINVINVEDTGYIDIYGEIKPINNKGDDETSVSVYGFNEAIKNLGDVSKIIVSINSIGGDVFEGITIHNILKRHKANITVNIEGYALSIASLIAMAGDTINMSDNSYMMIHCASTMVAGDPKELREMAETLDKIDDIICNSYFDKSKISKFELKNMMKKETWLNAEDCKKYGFIDNITTGKKISACADHKKINKYRNAPSTLISNHSRYYL
ncbi:head maturation protease, ClpP-related [Macrococcoides bohemicum]|uniref:head maturation protease, ClpP-related n=1 Tax=Macrococcoides bohemicum TaxID=1903056 RepID=UPI00193F055D|nr:head maturation protease, ClpP-related [Macrococcus bohemicus]QRN49963.1 Clp protease ClpP [Macrococcus bohemicus]